MNMGYRLREERRRIGMTQEHLAGIGGIAANAQVHYEHGTRQPRADYLAALPIAGIDVLYVVTGSRIPPPSQCLSEDEQLLIFHLRKAATTHRDIICGFVARMSERVQATGTDEVF